MKKYVVSVAAAISTEKVEAMQAKVASALGVDCSCVVVLSGATITEFDCPDPKPVPEVKEPKHKAKDWPA